ncbi:TrkA family potassium uptake protein [Candidatus Bathyarchaeota archaeon]|nr:TrkA family potassium uptake protein [Candidatus Bathyarchaeota archaeon]
MRIMIVGAGDIGMPLIDYLSDNGHLITVIEKDEKRCKYIADNADAAIFKGDGDDQEMWKNLEADKMDALIALTNDDETNLNVCTIAKKSYGIPFIVARANQPESLSLMRETGADVVICPSIEARHLFLNAIENLTIETLYERAESNFKLVMVMIPQNGSVIGQTIDKLDNSGKVKLASVFRNDTFVFPSESLVFKASDKVLLLGSAQDVEKAAEKFGRMEIT